MRLGLVPALPPDITTVQIIELFKRKKKIIIFHNHKRQKYSFLKLFRRRLLFIRFHDCPVLKTVDVLSFYVGRKKIYVHRPSRF